MHKAWTYVNNIIFVKHKEMVYASGLAFSVGVVSHFRIITDNRSNPLTENPSLAQLKNHHSHSLKVNKDACFGMMMY